MVFETYWTTTSGPNVSIFLRLRNKWDTIDLTQHKSGIEDEVVAERLADKKLEIIKFIHNCLQVKPIT